MGLASTARRPRPTAAGANAGQRSPAPSMSPAPTGSLPSKASTHGPSPWVAWSSSSGPARSSEAARLRRTWSRSTSISAVPSTPNRASAPATTRSRASSRVTGPCLRSASWSRAWRNPAADTVMGLAPSTSTAPPGAAWSVRRDPLVGPAADDPLVVGVAGRRVLDPLLGLLQQRPGLGVGVMGGAGVAGLGGQRPGPAVDLLGAGLGVLRLGVVGHLGSSGWRFLDAGQPSLLGLDPLGRGAEVEQGAPEGDRADHEPAEAEGGPADHVGQPVDPEQHPGGGHGHGDQGRPGGQPGLDPQRPAPPQHQRDRRPGGAGGRSRSTSTLTVLAIRFWPAATISRKASTARRRRSSHSSTPRATVTDSTVTVAPSQVTRPSSQVEVGVACPAPQAAALAS